MPEGDTVAGHAQRLARVLVGKEIVAVQGTSSSVRGNAHRVRGQIVEAVGSTGKNLVIELSGDHSILVHLGMSGRWLVLTADRSAPGEARLSISTDTHHVACLAASTVIVDRSPRIEKRLSSLGPDLVGEHWDEAEFLHRARTRGQLPASALLLDQRVAAGIGNVFKSEILFLEKIHPDTLVSHIPDEALAALGSRARRLIPANVGRPRSTTGERRRGRDTWVYGRHGKPCRRCGAAIEKADRQGRVTYWCPGCQPSPAVGFRPDGGDAQNG